MRRIELVSMTLLLILAAVFLPHPSSAQGKLDKMNIGYSAQAGAFAPIWITHDASFFKKNGLDVNLLFIPGGPTAAAGMIAGELQAVAMAGPGVVSSNLAGTELVMSPESLTHLLFK